MQAALTSLGLDEDFLEVLLIQLVTVMQDGEEVRMSKRTGQFVTLRDLVAETGPDVARYFFLMRRAEVPLTFDLDLALDTSEANPVYKVQYAHARMCSVFRRGEVDPETIAATDADLAHLDSGTGYHEGNLDPERRLLADGPSRPARLALARAVQVTLRSGLMLLGISAPERLERETG